MTVINKDFLAPGHPSGAVASGRCRTRNCARLFSRAPRHGPHAASRPYHHARSISLDDCRAHTRGTHVGPIYLPCPRMRAAEASTGLGPRTVSHSCALVEAAGICRRWVPLQHVQHLNLLLQHPDENTCNIRLKQLKHLQNTFETPENT